MATRTPQGAGQGAAGAPPDAAPRRADRKADAPLPVAALDGLGADAFTARFADVFERSPWVPRAAWSTRPWATVAELHAAMVAAVGAAPREQRLALLRAHPDLARVAVRASDVTAASSAEQAAAGLDALDEHGGDRLAALNRDYRARFGFPFIVCAREHTPGSILEQASARLQAAADAEERRALAEVAKIARLRLDDLVVDGEAP